MISLDTLCRPIGMILSDVDGVLTDGGLYYDNNGTELKRFFVRDGFAIKSWQQIGYHFGLITARSSQLVKLRADELGIEIVRQGVRDKGEAIEKIAEMYHLPLSKICYIGDDYPDLPAMRRVGFACTVADAPAEIKEAANWVTTCPGGNGAIRELIEFILKTQNLWSVAVQQYTFHAQVSRRGHDEIS